MPIKNDGRAGADEILSHIDRFGVERKDSFDEPVERPSRGAGTGGRRRNRRLTIDLHGLHSEEAERRLLNALERCRNRGMHELLVIHGYGLHSDPNEGPVLKKLVRTLLDGKMRHLYRAYRCASVSEGGEGATLIAVR